MHFTFSPFSSLHWNLLKKELQWKRASVGSRRSRRRVDGHQGGHLLHDE